MRRTGGAQPKELAFGTNFFELPGACSNFNRAGPINATRQFEQVMAAAHAGSTRSSPFFGLAHAKTPFGCTNLYL